MVEPYHCVLYSHVDWTFIQERLHKQVWRVKNAHHEGMSFSFWGLICPTEGLSLHCKVISIKISSLPEGPHGQDQHQNHAAQGGGADQPLDRK